MGAVAFSFDEQIERLVALGYPGLLGCDLQTFRRTLAGLRRAHVPDQGGVDLDRGQASFILVVNCPAAPVAATLPLVKRQGRQAIHRLYPREPEFFRPIGSLALPRGDAYLLLDVDRGNDTLNATPLVAQAMIEAAGRSPLTVEEGVALLTQAPEFLQPNRCFMTLGSRGDDKRVPALWLSGKQPKLGWCWEGNPHTWLGFASCLARSAAVSFPLSGRQEEELAA
ncbi:hypothetical protein G8A07_00075 [Roseateles sp. DAIF2]|uniref:DUF5701 family protein n=1 Tax=Roseateles sp. DAIF2 TaxID=2714952 RepID=UPI0018A30457|nr:DUF5701 family protein [Roseateles sp. DAIF2]QPF71473.1 hypothetical protein G8A07_00075 [Roseateles sp. DAIF2]